MILESEYVYKQLIFFDVGTFIKLHNEVNKHIRYCECIIDRNGLVSYAHPSHIEASYSLYEYEYEKTRKDIDDEILSKGLIYDVLGWNNYMTNSISVWYDRVDISYLGEKYSECYPKYNDKQILTLIRLTEAKCISPNIMLNLKIYYKTPPYSKRFEKLSESIKRKIRMFAPRF